MHNNKLVIISLVLLRMAIGWHFFYEGMVKVLNPSWTSKAWLLDSGGPFENIFVWMANHQTVLSYVDLINAWGLTLIGLTLLLGLFSRIGSLAGMFLLLLYYLSHPASPGIEYIFPPDGSYFIINKTIVELLALFVVFAFPTAKIIGLERLWGTFKK